MYHEDRTNWTRHHGGRPPPTFADLRGWKGSAIPLPSSPAQPEEGLTLDSARRYRSLLVPVDGSPFGEHALPLALGIARRSGADVRLVHVHSPLEVAYRPEQEYYDGPLDTWLERRQSSYLDKLVRRLARVTSVPVTPVLMRGREVADSLCRAAESGADLVVMATHGRGPLGRFWCGSIADVLTRRLSVPLLLVRGQNAPADLTGDPLVRQVLIPLDGTPFAEQVLEPAVALGSLLGAEHTLLRVLPLAAAYTAGSGELRRSTADRDRAEAWRYLSGAAHRLGRQTPGLHPRVVLDDQPTASAILCYAQRHDADLIALATRGRGGLSRLFRGSAAEQVIRKASVPVLVVRTADEQRLPRSL